jgi:hypothetical protein
MFRMLIDACVWLDLVKDPRQVPVMGVIEEMVGQKLIEIIVPSINNGPSCCFSEFLRETYWLG